MVVTDEREDSEGSVKDIYRPRALDLNICDQDLNDYMTIKEYRKTKEHVLKPLPYKVDALEPVFSEELM